MARTRRALAPTGRAPRFTLPLSADVRARLEQLARDHGISQAEVVRRLVLGQPLSQ